MSLTRVRMTSRSSFSVDSSVASAVARRRAARASTSSSRDRRWFSSAARACSALHPLDHADQQLHLFLEPIDRFEIHAARRCFGHSHQLTNSSIRYRCTARMLARRAPPESRRRSAAPPRRSACDRPPGTSAAPTGSPRPPARPCPDSDRKTLDADERRRHVAAGGQNGATNDLGRQGVGDDDRQIADDERMPRQRPRRVARRRAARADSASRSQLRDEHAILARQAARVGDRRRHLAGDADRAPRPAPSTRIAAAWPATRNGSRAGSNAHRHAERVAQLLDDALDVEEVDLARAARPVLAAAAPVQASATPRVSPSRREPRADLEQPHVAPAVTAVVRDGVDEAGQERRPQRVELRRQRVGDGDRLRAGSPSVRRNSSAAFASMKPNVTASEKPAAVSDAAHEPVARRCADPAAAPARDGGKRRLELVEAVVAADFLDEIGFAQRDRRGRSGRRRPSRRRPARRRGRGRAGCARRRRPAPSRRAAAPAARGAGGACGPARRAGSSRRSAARHAPGADLLHQRDGALRAPRPGR